MKRAEIFALIAGAIGFIVDIAALVALLFGVVTLPAGSFLQGSPIALAVILWR